MTKRRKKIAVVTTSRADYGRMRSVLHAIQQHPQLELQVIVGVQPFFEYVWWPLRHGNILGALRSLWWGSKLFSQGRTSADYLARTVKNDGFPVSASIPMFRKGGTEASMLAGTTASLSSIHKALKRFAPDMVLMHGDRFELLGVAMTAAALNIPLAHVEGGDVSGTIDESVRHALSKFSHVHFPITEKSKDRLVRMGEDPRRVFVSGMAALDVLADIDFSLGEDFYRRNPEGPYQRIDFSKPFVLVLYHPVTTRGKENARDIEALLAALARTPIQKVILGSNIDAGSSHIADSLWRFALDERNRAVLHKSVPVEDFYRLLKKAAVAVGNSSSFLREAAFFGTPVVLVGDRQIGRERGDNIIEAPHDAEKIAAALEEQKAKEHYHPDHRFGAGKGTGQFIADTLASLEDISTQKNFYE